MNRLTTLIAGRDPVLVDGAMGTMLQDAGLEPGGAGELWNVEQPHRRLVDRLLEALVQRRLDLVVALARDDHGGELAPVRDLVFGHYSGWYFECHRRPRR